MAGRNKNYICTLSNVSLKLWTGVVWMANNIEMGYVKKIAITLKYVLCYGYKIKQVECSAKTLRSLFIIRTQYEIMRIKREN